MKTRAPNPRVFLRLLAASTLVLVAVAGATAQEFDDALFVYNDSESGRGKLSNVRVETDGIALVTYAVRGSSSTSTKPSAEVYDIRYGDTPDVWDEAMSAFNKRQWTRAIQSFDVAVSTHEDAGKVRAWIVPAARFHQARARLALAQGNKSNAPAAVSAWREWLSNYSDHRLAPQAYDYAGQAMMLAGEGRDALSNYERLKAVAVENDLHVVHRLVADLGIATANDSLGNWALAIPAYGAVRETAQSEARFLKIQALKAQVEAIVYVAAAKRGEAMLAKAEAANGEGNSYGQARQYFSSLTAEISGDARIAAIADIGVAICKLQESDPREALRELAEAKVKHFAATEEVAKALFYMAKAARKLDHERQAAAFEKELKEMYPDSIWARKTK